jgi:hypothetical protein
MISINFASICSPTHRSNVRQGATCYDDSHDWTGKQQSTRAFSRNAKHLS